MNTSIIGGVLMSCCKSTFEKSLSEAKAKSVASEFCSLFKKRCGAKAKSVASEFCSLFKKRSRVYLVPKVRWLRMVLYIFFIFNYNGNMLYLFTVFR